MSIVYRQELGRELTWSEADNNFAELKAGVDSKKSNFDVLPVTQGGTGQTTVDAVKVAFDIATKTDLADSGGAALVGYDGGSMQDIADVAKTMQNYTELRAYTGRATNVRITASGVAGIFSRDDSDTTTADNGGTVLVDAIGRRWKRIFDGLLNVKWFGAKGDGVADDTAEAQMASDALLLSDSYGILFPFGNYKINGEIIIYRNNVVIDGDGSTFSSDTTLDENFSIFKCTPKSLIDSGRFAGTDYPETWRKVDGTPVPFEGDFNTMMHEHVDALRLKNISFKNIRVSPEMRRVFLISHSVDGLKIEGCDIRPISRAAARIHHCQGISLTDNTIGGTGSYNVFFFKSRLISISGNSFVAGGPSSQIVFKGCYHVESSIFLANSSSIVDSSLSIVKNTFSAINSSYLYTIRIDLPATGNLTTDPVEEQGGSPIGFTKRDWRGFGRGYDVSRNVFIAQTEGTALFIGNLSENITVQGNRLHNSRIGFLASKNLSICSNVFSASDELKSAIIFDEDPVFNTTANGFICSDNIFAAINTVPGYAVISCRGVSGLIVNNVIKNPGGNAFYGVAISTGSVSVHAANNVVYKGAESNASLVPVYITPGTNVNGSKYLNTIVDDVAGTRTFDLSFDKTLVLSNTLAAQFTATDPIINIGSTREYTFNGYARTVTEGSTGVSNVFYGGGALVGLINANAGTMTLAHYGTNTLRINTNGAGRLDIDTASLRPLNNNAMSLGASGLRWTEVFAVNGTINTSDANAKEQIVDIDAAVLRAWSKVNFSQYKMRHAVAQKGESARWHFGVIAQRVKDAFESEGLDPFAYGILCYDEWDDQFEPVLEVVDITGEDGIVRTEVVDTGELKLTVQAGASYGIRYEEALALECAYLRSKFNTPVVI